MTKIDKDVRAAREIPASEFSVDDELLRRIEGIWMKHFVPARWGVRAEPYKIHLYGPGDHFKLHRDTPQNDLVGTFLVGLGQSSTTYGGLVVDGTKMSAYPASWCAFYPDVPHRVQAVGGGHRAVIAFKLFRVQVARAALETEQTAEIRAKVAQIIGEVEAPYGVLLSHKYSLMTRHFNGFDAILVDAIQAEAHRLGPISLHRLPVVVTTGTAWGTRSDHPDEYYEMCCRTRVYALTSGHIDIFATLGEDAYDRKFTHTACGCPWLEGVKSVPFYTVDLSDSTLFQYKKSEEETCNYVGNEAQAWRADSVYLSFALLVLPKPSECVDRQETGLEVSTGAEGNEDAEGSA
ncbi:hypothetical protein C2E23DRAFT_804570 [Lenzites betulinus]|nr:hypothetical protein C2E23DRAFT_804570 [Lenzites betulinus]